MKIAHLTFDSFENDSRILKESISLSSIGHYVCVVAHGSLNLKKEEKQENFQIKRLSYLNREKHNNVFKKIYAYIKYLYLSAKYTKEFEVLHCNDLDTLPIAFLVKKFYNSNIKVVYDAHEHETERHHQSNLLKKVLKVAERFLLKYVDKVITVSEPIAKDYVNLYKIEMPTIIYNAPHKFSIKKQNLFREKFNIPQNNIIFLYQGGLQEGRGILEFFELIKDKQNITYVVMGFGLLKDKIIELSQQYPNIFFHDAVSPDVLLTYTSSADIGVCIEENRCKSWDFALPNKVFEYHMVGLPILVSGLSELKRFIKNHHTGFILNDIFNQQEFNQLLPIIIKEYQDKQKYIQNVQKIYNWEEQEKKLFTLYQNIENLSQKIGKTTDDKSL